MRPFLAIIVSLILVVGIHEAGHALVASYFGIRIRRISIGLGRPLLSWRRKNYELAWGMWPLGGYVQLLNTRIAKVDKKNHQECFDKKPISVRILVLLAGGIANFLLSVFLLTLYFYIGYTQQKPVVAEVIPNSIASQAGIAAGDRFLMIDNVAVGDWQDLTLGLINNLEKPLVITKVVNKENKEKLIELKLTQFAFKAKGDFLRQLGLIPDKAKNNQQHVSGKPLTTSLALAIHKSLVVIASFFTLIKLLILAKIPLTALLGPISLFAATAQSLQQGAMVFVYFTAVLSLAVGTINLLPFPGLDGGAILYSFLEKIRGKPLSIAWEILIYRTALIAFFIILMQLIVNDLRRLGFS